MATRRFKVIIQTLGSDRHELMRRASNPVEAVNRALYWLGLDDIQGSPFTVFVKPIGSIREDGMK
jgi:hypothetical protein